MHKQYNFVSNILRFKYCEIPDTCNNNNANNSEVYTDIMYKVTQWCYFLINAAEKYF